MTKSNSSLLRYNILTGEFMDYILDYKYYGGKCEYVYNGDWRRFTYESVCENLGFNDQDKNFRKPYNYHAYRFVVRSFSFLFFLKNFHDWAKIFWHKVNLLQAQARSEGSYEYYDDMVSMLNARQTTNSANRGHTVGIYHVEVGVHKGTEAKFLKNITKYQSQVRPIDARIGMF